MKNQNILLVEDDSNDEELVRLALEEQSIPFELHVARDGAEAVDFLLRKGKYANLNAQNPSLVLLDLKLRKLNGIEILKATRDHLPTRHVPIVVFTSSREESDIRDCYQHGANAFVRKPIEYSEFSETIKKIVSFWLDLNNIMPESSEEA